MESTIGCATRLASAPFATTTGLMKPVQSCPGAGISCDSRKESAHMKSRHVYSLVLSALLAAGTGRAANVTIDADDIGGSVTSAKGPESGVWVIAETSDFA